jgi:hypothetical protein
MNNRIDIINELREISPLLGGMEKVNVFTVPTGYFEQMAGNMLTLVKQEANSLLLAHKQQPLMDVPAGYFDSLADNILNKIKQQEAVEAYPLLNSISKDNVYTVPQGYFESVSAAILNKVNKPQAKVVGMGSKTGWFKYAAAAVFTGIIAFGTFKFTSTGTKLDAATKTGIEIAQQNRFDAELEKVADEDIIKYLQAEGSDVEASLVATAIDEKELPSQEDYLLDEKTLDNFLENVDLNDFKN